METFRFDSAGCRRTRRSSDRTAARLRHRFFELAVGHCTTDRRGFCPCRLSCHLKFVELPHGRRYPAADSRDQRRTSCIDRQTTREPRVYKRFYRYQPELCGHQFCTAAGRSSAGLRCRIGDRYDDASDLGCRISGRAVVRHHRQRNSVHRRRRTQGRNRSSEDIG